MKILKILLKKYIDKLVKEAVEKHQREAGWITVHYDIVRWPHSRKTCEYEIQFNWEMDCYRLLSMGYQPEKHPARIEQKRMVASLNANQVEMKESLNVARICLLL